MAGLLLAGELADHFAEVTSLDRDVLPSAPGAPRRGVPQGRHVHVLLGAGERHLRSRFPVEDLVALGAHQVDLASGRMWVLGERPVGQVEPLGRP
jgi:hypothetical protein